MIALAVFNIINNGQQYKLAFYIISMFCFIIQCLQLIRKV